MRALIRIPFFFFHLLFSLFSRYALLPEFLTVDLQPGLNDTLDLPYFLLKRSILKRISVISRFDITDTYYSCKPLFSNIVLDLGNIHG